MPAAARGELGGSGIMRTTGLGAGTIYPSCGCNRRTVQVIPNSKLAPDDCTRGRDDHFVRIHLESERLVLRELTVEDVDHLLALDTDPDVARWSIDPMPCREDVEQRHLPYFLRLYKESPGYGFWAAEDRTVGTFLGWFHLRPREGHPDDEPELGYRLRWSAWGRGYATEGSRALIDKAFTELPVRRVLAETAGFHVASRRVMEKSGLRLMREYESSYPPLGPDDILGDVEYAITREEWDQQRQSS
jgi:RimJ/RimL family protein N-acetyltransferase